MTREEFKARWEKDDNGDGLTFDDVAECAKEWGLYNTPRTHNILKVKEAVLKYAGVNP